MKNPLDLVYAALHQATTNIAAARANLDAAEAAQSFGRELLAALEPDDSGPCRHEDREEMGTLDQPDRWRCRTCGFLNQTSKGGE